jgi:hypothetical protein
LLIQGAVLTSATSDTFYALSFMCPSAYPLSIHACKQKQF